MTNRHTAGATSHCNEERIEAHGGYGSDHDAGRCRAGNSRGTLSHPQNERNKVGDEAHAYSVDIHAGQTACDGIGYSTELQYFAKSAASASDHQDQTSGNEGPVGRLGDFTPGRWFFPTIIATNTPISIEMVLLPEMR